MTRFRRGFNGHTGDLNSNRVGAMKRRGLLLDRDGVINVDRGYVGTREQFHFMSDVFPFLATAQDRGYRLAILTNQAGVARGYYTAQDFEALTEWMRQELSRNGIAIDLVLACYEHPEGKVPSLRRESFWRKPNPGMVLDSVQRLNLDPARSVFIGDQIRDMQAAQSAGIGACLLMNDHITEPLEGVTRVADFSEALCAMPNPFA